MAKVAISSARIVLLRSWGTVLRLGLLFLVALVLSYFSGVLLERYGSAVPHARTTQTFSSDIAMHRNEILLQNWMVEQPGLNDHSPEFVYVSRQPWCVGHSQVYGQNMEYQVLQTRGGFPFWSVQNQIWCYPGSTLLPREVAVWNMPWAGRPLWPGLIANAAVYFIVIVVWSYVFASRFAERMRRGKCVHCKYHCDDLSTCPECGRDPYLRRAHGIWRIQSKRLPADDR